MDSELDPTEDGAHTEAERINRVYRDRATPSNESLYRADRPEVRIQVAELDAVVTAVVRGVGLPSRLRFLDVGCGSGTYLQKVIGLGADPRQVAGTELVAERLDRARQGTVPGPLWHLGPLSDLDTDEAFDVVSAFTVFSSILDDAIRSDLAAQMWDRTAPGGVVMIYDFRYNNPRNPNVRKVVPSQLSRWFPPSVTSVETLTLAPPIARPVARVAPALVSMLGRVPPLRSHFLFVARKPA